LSVINLNQSLRSTASSNSIMFTSEPPVVTEEFFGDGGRKIGEVLSRPKSSEEKHEYESQPSSASRLHISEALRNEDGRGLKQLREGLLAGSVRDQYTQSKNGRNGGSSARNAGEEKQRDKKDAKERALREKTQIEFFERG